jgi:hypothetical protein
MTRAPRRKSGFLPADSPKNVVVTPVVMHSLPRLECSERRRFWDFHRQIPRSLVLYGLKEVAPRLHFIHVM